MFYIQVPLLCIWLVVTCLIGLIQCPFRWGDIDQDHDFARLFSWGALKICRVKLDLQGQEHWTAHQPCVYALNHQGAMDLVVYGAIYPRRTVVVGKKELIWIPFFGLFFVASGNVLINRQKRAQAVAELVRVVNQAVKKKGISVWIFPEGTRNRSDQPLLPFKKGAFYVAAQAGIPIVPIVSSSYRELFDLKKRILRPGVVQIKFLPPIHPSGVDANSIEVFSGQVRESMLEAIRSLRT